MVAHVALHPISKLFVKRRYIELQAIFSLWCTFTFQPIYAHHPPPAKALLGFSIILIITVIRVNTGLDGLL